MEQLISDIEAFCARHGIAPERLLRDAVNATWPLWQKWKDGVASPTMKVADRVRAYMAEHDNTHPPAHGVPTQADQGAGG